MAQLAKNAHVDISWLATGDGESPFPRWTEHQYIQFVHRLHDASVIPSAIDPVKHMKEGGPFRRAAILGGKSDIPPKRLHLILQGKSSTPTKYEIHELATAIGVSYNWLLTGEGRPEDKDDVGETAPPAPAPAAAVDIDAEYVLLPRYDVSAAAGRDGKVIVHSEQIVDHIAFRRDWIRHRLRLDPDRVALVETCGDSMEPTIQDGDLLLLDLSMQEIHDNAIYAISMGGGVMVKRIQRIIAGDRIRIISDNPRYQSEDLSTDQVMDLRIIGKVAWHGHPFRGIR
jgi:phage repressor protein C with HTH and peptisase S24 domain